MRTLIKDKLLYHERELLRKNKLLCMRKTKSVINKECASFYKSLSNEWEDHLAVHV